MRLLHLSKRAQNAGHELAPRGTRERTALAQVLQGLTDEATPLVGPGDREVPGGNDVFVVNIVRAG